MAENKVFFCLFVFIEMLPRDAYAMLLYSHPTRITSLLVAIVKDQQ
ncbi:hypothetical protein SAMN04488541_102433 [Thermoflexibacter ruber]|uniref:Uncharacterized protein n=1 Tax=Thermoflexibacter ruber TaxID=1003 RepID=A0A1I2HJK7_9BACT|nr:hypothetical protein SAMN04488541_102433 [Thermoflexibacter ruber]